MSRLPPRPGQLIDRSKPLTFTFDGGRVEAFAGDSIGSALYAAGRRTFSRSFKYHRRRGLMCCSGSCPNCLVAVDGAPGVRACTEPAQGGAVVEHLNAWPGLETDVMSAVDRVPSSVTPPGFYYKTFIRPRRLWPAYEWLLRRAAGLGRLPREQADRRWRTEYRCRHADVLVVGAGRSGLNAAIAAAEAGADVVLVDEGPKPGGRLLWEGGHEQAHALASRARAAGVEILCTASALGHYEGLVPVWQGDTLHQIRARRHVYATGAIEQPMLFAGNDLPGVMLSSGALRLAALYGVRPGSRAVVATVSDRGIEAAAALADLGPEVAFVADAREGWTVAQAHGKRRLTAVTLARQGQRQEVECDLLVVSGGEAPATGLLSQAGARVGYNAVAGHFVVEESPPDVVAVGRVAAGAAGAPAPAWRPAPTAPAPAPHENAIACFCEDVTVKDIQRSVREGYDSIELCKRFTTATMGPCQGRMCQLHAIRLTAAETGQSLDEVGTTTARPPWSTVPLGVLAGRPFEPAKRSSIQPRHRALGATLRWAGDWQRPYDYGDPEGEALNVHERAGLIDVSTLGKLLVRGPEAGAFLDRLYPNRHSTLKPGRVRYSVLTSDAGRIIDDGTVTRLDDETFYVTTTSSGAGAVEQWFAWWLADWRMDVQLTDVTQALAAVNLAGPRAREILARLTELDCGPQAFAYLDAKQARVAGVAALLLRIGFVGELGYEIHFPSAHGEQLWDAILDAGAHDGIRPFGLEPQRILRLEKQHIIVGQDTDSESTPLGAGMPWAVKLDKQEAFIGKWALERVAGQPQETALVGFTVEDGRVPTEGSVILGADGSAAGLVTSARRSRQLGRVIGMGWVPAALAGDGSTVTIVDNGARLEAAVVTEPFHDPAGELLRS